MSFKARCPNCRMKMRFPSDAAGGSIECPRCHNFFTAAPEDDAPLPATFRRLPPRRVQGPVASSTATAEAGLSADGSSPAMAAAVPAPATSSVPAYAEPPATRQANLWGVLSFLFGSAGLLCASLSAFHLLTIPLTAAGVLLGITGLMLAGERRKGVALPALGTMICFPVLAMALFWPYSLSDSYGRSRSASLPDNSKPLVIVTRRDHVHEPARPAPGEPVAADLNGVRLGDVQVRVLRVQERWIELSGRSEKPPVAQKSPSLVITIRAANVGTNSTIQYKSWGAAVGARAAYAPRLEDDRGRRYDLETFGGVPVAGRFRDKELAPGKFVNDDLIFPRPAVTAEYFTLELPGAAVGAAESCKFKIPRALINREHGPVKNRLR